MNVYWLEQSETDIAAGDDWLSAAECARLGAMRVAKRRADWRLGRWTAKSAIAAYLNLGSDLAVFSNIELRAAPCGAPDAFVDNEPAPLRISLSHSAGTAACALAEPGIALGCDLEQIEPRSEAFVADFFSAREQAFLARVPAEGGSRLVNLFWSAKEGALKALRVGLRLDTRSVVIDVLDSYLYNAAPLVWRRFHVAYRAQSIEGWWRDDARLLRALVASPPSSPPILLTPAAARQQISSSCSKLDWNPPRRGGRVA